MIHIIENGVVVNTIVATLDEGAAVGECIDATLHVGGIGWSWDGVNLIPPATPSKPVPELIADRLAEINVACEAEIAAIKAGYPEAEVLSWPKQEAEARAYVADANAATPLLDAMAAARSLTKTDLAARIIAKAGAFAAYSGALIGKRQALEDALVALPADAVAADVEAIKW